MATRLDIDQTDQTYPPDHPRQPDHTRQPDHRPDPTSSAPGPGRRPGIGDRMVGSSSSGEGHSPDHAALQKLPVPQALEVVAWSDPSFANTGHDPRSPYVEKFWLGLLGPSTTWMIRRFARGLQECPSGFRVDMVETGRALGLGESLARNSSTQRSVLRACQFGAAYRMTEHRLAVRTHLPTLTRRQLSRLPEALQLSHDRWLDRPVDEFELRTARAGASGLASAGERPSDIERQLRSWGYGPQVARDATRAVQGWQV